MLQQSLILLVCYDRVYNIFIYFRLCQQCLYLYSVDKKTNDKLFGMHNVGHETTIQLQGSLFFKFYFDGFFFKIEFLHVFTITKFVTCRILNGSHNAYYSTTS